MSAVTHYDPIQTEIHRYCLGAPLAPPEARIALELLYKRLPDLKADFDQELEFLPSPIGARDALAARDLELITTRT
jgi:hypothetical protein